VASVPLQGLTEKWNSSAACALTEIVPGGQRQRDCEQDLEIANYR